MKTILLMERLKEKPVFKVADIERISLCSKKYAWLTLNRLKKAGFITRITKNVYTTDKNAFVVASNIAYPSYISFLSASSFLGYTEQKPYVIQVAATRRIKEIYYKGYKIEFTSLRHFFGYKKLATEQGEVFIAENEKLMMDAFERWKEMGNFDEIIKVFEKADISEEKLVEYLKKANSKAIIKRVGCLLEKKKGVDISRHFKPDNNYIRLNPFSKKAKIKNSKWRVVE